MADGVAVRLPKLSLATSEATVVEWLVEDGALVSEGQALYVIETEKVETEVEASTSGVLRQSAQAGETFEVGTQIGTIEGVE